MTTYTNTRGSEWRKWDLHVHTPESGLNNQFGADWDLYVKELFNSAIENNISAIGITDYFTIDGYKKLKKEYLENESKLLELFDNDQEKVAKIHQILILPNIEFRLHTIVQKGNKKGRVNYHVIFSNDVDENQIEENFLHEIDFTYESIPSESRNTRKLKKINIEALGRKIKEDQPDAFPGSPFEVGCSVVTINNEDITKILNSHKDIFTGKYFIVIPVDEDLSKISWNGQDHMVRKSAYQEADMFFTSNENTRNFGLGKTHRSVEDFIKEFKTIKPCIHGSDAHSTEQLFKPDGNRYCWIKADPSFEGLKQILYEPESRVRIQQSKPEQKSDYQLIDSISLSEDSFWNDIIYLNPNLNTIIGGRATGKSTLLSAIAKKTDNSIKSVQTDFSGDHLVGVTVNWANEEDWKEHDIEYFWQGYMFEVAGNPKQTNELIQRIIKADSRFQNVVHYEQVSEELTLSLKQKLDSILKLQKELNSIQKNLKEKGNKEGVRLEIKKINKTISDFGSGLDVTESELQDFQKKQSEIAILEQSIKTLSNDISLIISLKSKTLFNPAFEDYFIELSDTTKSDIQSTFHTIVNNTTESWNKELDNSILQINQLIEGHKASIVGIKSDTLFVKCSQHYEKNAEMKIWQDKLKLEQANLSGIEELEKKISTMEDLLKDNINDVIVSNKKFYSEIKKLTDTFEIEHKTIRIGVSSKYDKDKLKNFLESRLNKKGKDRQDIIDSFVENYEINPEAACRDILNKLFDGLIQCISNFEQNQVVAELLSTNWFSYDYSIKYEGDEFGAMSPGKKAIVILKLELDFSNKKCPILIDQPEDSLDNRAIYKDLVQYIRTKKTERQIILVTHNPNIVVGADAENVIVANQHGDKNENRDDCKFQYVNGSLEDIVPIDKNSTFVLEKKSIREHVCEILEGGEEAFQKREQKYNL